MVKTAGKKRGAVARRSSPNKRKNNSKKRKRKQSSKKKKKKHPRTTPSDGGNGAGGAPSFQRFPYEVLAKVVLYCGDCRTTINNLSETCRSLFLVIKDPEEELKLMPKKDFPPWPKDVCPLPPLTFRSGVFFSGDGSRVAVSTGGERGPWGGTDTVPRKLAFYDRAWGILGRIECDPCLRLTPVFSPDNQAVLFVDEALPFHERGVKVCLLPRSRKQLKKKKSATLPVSHRLSGDTVAAFSFLDDSTVCFDFQDEADLTVCKFTRCVASARFTTKETIPIGVEEVMGGRLASFSSEKKDLLAHVNARGLTVHDLRRNVSVTRRFPLALRDVAFARGGDILVASTPVGFEGLYLFDCSAERVEDLGEVPMRYIMLPPGSLGYISPVPNRNKILVGSMYTETADRNQPQISIVDVESGQVERWSGASTWKMLLAE